MTTPTLTFKPGSQGNIVQADLDRLIVSRLLIQANSGGGKSRALRALLEQTFGRVQHFIIDPEGEFFTLREKFDYVLAARTGGDVVATPKTAKLLCRRLVESGASAVLDLYDLPLQERREFVKVFLSELMALPRSLWRPILVVIDEMHVFAPERGHGDSAALDEVIALGTQGRKRGFCLIGATQRISKLHKDVAAELLNKMIGRVGLDVDVKRAAEEIGFDKDARQSLKRLQPGQFYVYGPAISNEVQIIRTGEVITTHPEPGAVSKAAPPPPAKVKALLAQLADLPQQAEAEARTIDDYKRVNADLTRKVKQLERTGVERVVEKPIVDQRAIDRAVVDVRRGYEKQIDIIVRVVRRMMAQGEEIATSGKTLVTSIENVTSGDSRAEVQVGNHGKGTGANHTPDQTARQQARSTPRPAVTHSQTDEVMTKPQLRMINALASFEAIGVDQLAKSHVAVYSDQSSRSSGFRANLSQLSVLGLIERVGSDTIRLTDEGRASAVADAAPASLEELHQAWMDKLSSPQRLMLSLLIEDRADGIEKEDLARRSGQSPLSSGYRANLSTLSALGLVKRESGAIKVTDLLFPRGLAA